MEEEYREVLKRFYAVYRPIQKSYGLRLHSYFSICGDGLIEIWEYQGEMQGKCICRVREAKDVDCYKKAIEELEHYKKKKEAVESRRGAAIAG